MTPSSSQQQHHFSILQIIAKTIAWLIIILLSVVAFGAMMSHRYRVYYFLRGMYYVLYRNTIYNAITMYQLYIIETKFIAIY